jgi:flagellar assembly factor FliW
MTAAVVAGGPSLAIRSELLGTLEIPDSQIFEAPAGLYGFPDSRRFALVPASRDGMFWLQSVEFSALAFLLADPFSYFPSYHLDLDDADTARLGTRDPQDILTLAIVTLPAGREVPWTANLHAPVLFNIRQRRAFQSIRGDDSYSICETFDPQLTTA